MALPGITLAGYFFMLDERYSNQYIKFRIMEKQTSESSGLAVMGENLARNMERHGFRVSVYNRTAPGEEHVVERFIEHYGTWRRFTPTRSIAELAESVARPRKIMMMVKAGSAVDELIGQLLPHLDRGDVIIDGGNSSFIDTTVA